MAERSTQIQRDDTTPAVEAVEVLVLWRPAPGGSPVFVIVVDEDSQAESTMDSLLDIVDRATSDIAAVSLAADCQWSVVHPREQFLRLTVRASAPLTFAVEILVPAQCFLGLGDVVASGVTIGVTTRQHARRLVARTDGSGLPGVVLLGCRTSGELAAVANLLCRNEHARS